jgi:pimeloyl-ACP methyl ester carboxylesterase
MFNKKRVGKVLIKVILGLIILILLAVITLLSIRGIKRSSIRKEIEIESATGIDIEETPIIGGIKQYLNIRGEDSENPVILFLHGGPGSPMTPLIHTYQTRLEKEYTVVNWDQRNAGKTYFLNDAKKVYKSLSLEQLVLDTKDVVDYLMARFNEENIIIMGHSWGTVLGTAYIQTYPETVKAYIAIGVVTNAEEGDAFAFDAALKKAKELGQKQDIEKMRNLEHYQLSDPDFDVKAFKTARKMINHYLAPDIKDNTLSHLFFSPYYSLKDLSFFLKDSFAIQKPLMDELSTEYDIENYGTVYDVPVIYILGEQDWVTPTVLAEAFFSRIEAPHKEMIIINEAGHMVMLDQPNQFSQAVIRSLEQLKQ